MQTPSLLQHEDARRRVLLALSLGPVLTSGCVLLSGSVNVDVTIDAARDLNPDARGRPSPVALKLFELKSLTAFERADFFSLFDRERETLGAELVARDDFVVKPGDHLTQERKVAKETRFLGLLVGYRDLERAQWRLAIPIEQARANPLLIQLDATRVSLKGK